MKNKTYKKKIIKKKNRKKKIKKIKNKQINRKKFNHYLNIQMIQKIKNKMKNKKMIILKQLRKLRKKTVMKIILKMQFYQNFQKSKQNN